MTNADRYAPQDVVDGALGWRQIAFQCLALLVVVSLGLSSLGPMLDHHFAERHPGHGHFYLGAKTYDHSHNFDNTHTHDVLSVLKSARAYPLDADNEGIVFFSPYAGAAPGVADLTLPMTPPSFVGMGGTAAHLIAVDRNRGVLGGTTIAPPTRPPRA